MKLVNRIALGCMFVFAMAFPAFGYDGEYIINIGEAITVSCGSDTVTVSWASSDETIASCDQMGYKELGSKRGIPESWYCENTIVGKKEGSAEITLSKVFDDKGTVATFLIRVTDQEGHIWEPTLIKKEPTCIEKGVQEVTCIICGEVRTSELPVSDNHQWETTKIVDKAPTCEEPGSKSIHCSLCGIKQNGSIESVAATGHDWGQWIQISPATCTEDEILTRECKICETTETTVGISHTGHDNQILRNQKAATCSSEGYTGDWYCTNCNTLTIYGETIARKDHSWDKGVIIQPLTNNADGVAVYTCTVCGEKRNEKITKCKDRDTLLQEAEERYDAKKQDAIDDNNRIHLSVQRDIDNLVRQGYYTGSASQYNSEISELDKQIRNLSAQINTLQGVSDSASQAKLASLKSQKAKYETQRKTLQESYARKQQIQDYQSFLSEVDQLLEKGLREYKKEYEEEVEEINKLPKDGHITEKTKGVTATCTKDGVTKGEKCTVCGLVISEPKKIPAKGHAYGNWETVKKPTYDTEGKEQRVCANDKTHIETRAIAKLEKPADTTPSSKTEYVPTVTEMEKAITHMESDGDPENSTFGLLQAKIVKTTNTTIQVQWKKVKGATKYVVYGNKCGKKNKPKKLKTVTGTTYTQKKLKKGTYYKYLVVAVKGNKAISTSKMIHATTNGKYGNAVKITVSKTDVTVKKGKTYQIIAKVQNNKKAKKHRDVAYESSNPKIAKVTAEGKIKGLKKGTCNIYAYAQNGLMKKIKVTVK